MHDAPYLSIYLLGAYRERGDVAEVAIDGPAAAFHPAGSAHEDSIGPVGLRALLVAFDPAWLRRRLGPAAPDRSTYWTAGPAASAAARLAAAALGSNPGQTRLIESAAALIARCAALEPASEPPWLTALDKMLETASGQPDTGALARRAGVSLPWMQRAYRAWRGEGIGDRLRRRALERALMLIEQHGAPLADAALAAGFCDQSHLTRVCRRLVGETPGRIASAAASL